MRALIVLVMLLTVHAGHAYAFDGPLQVRNQFPLFLGIAPPFLEGADVRDLVILSLHYSSTYMTEDAPRWSVNMDLELAELDVRLKKRVGERAEIGIDVPVIRPTGGFLDGPLEAWHDLLPFGDYGRHERPQNEFLYEVLRDGKPVIQGVNGRTGLGDVRLSLKQVVTASTATISAMAAVELPTGDARTGYGNGSYDLSLALLADRRWGSTYYGYANAGYMVPGDLKGYQTVALRNAWYAGVGLEAAWWERFRVIVQTVVQRSPLPETGIDHVDWPGILLTFGGRYLFQNGSLEISLTEDPDVAGAPDFIANVAWMLNY